MKGNRDLAHFIFIDIFNVCFSGVGRTVWRARVRQPLFLTSWCERGSWRASIWNLTKSLAPCCPSACGSPAFSLLTSLPSVIFRATCLIIVCYRAPTSLCSYTASAVLDRCRSLLLCRTYLQGSVAPRETLHLQKHPWRHGYYLCVIGSRRSFCHRGAPICSARALASGISTRSTHACAFSSALLWSCVVSTKILLTEEFVEQMLGDIQELGARDEVRAVSFALMWWFCLLLICFTCLPSFYRQSCQRSTIGQKRSWRFLYYQTLFLITLFSEIFNLFLSHTLTPHHHDILPGLCNVSTH